MDDAYGDGSAVGGRPRFVGYVLGEEARVYHAGDTIVTDELTSALALSDVDVALLPINGRDAEREARGIVGNMDAAEAVELALAHRRDTARPLPLGRLRRKHGASGRCSRRCRRADPGHRPGAFRRIELR